MWSSQGLDVNNALRSLRGSCQRVSNAFLTRFFFYVPLFPGLRRPRAHRLLFPTAGQGFWVLHGVGGLFMRIPDPGK